VWNLDSAVAFSRKGTGRFSQPGVLEPLRKSVFKGAGFVEDPSTGALIKGGLAVESVGGFWIIGKPETIASLGVESEKKEFVQGQIGETKSEADAASPINIFLPPDGIEKISADVFGPEAPDALEKLVRRVQVGRRDAFA